ncbi:MAG: DNA gyrase inhibitor YacG [Acidobacteria bacterium]|nr:DNA gyrase inhibitor YacG [Acidobacteriota bacterium]
MSEVTVELGQTVCVYCRNREAAPEWKPFCSERCKQLDLRNWVDGRYRIPGDSTTVPDGKDGESPS